MVELYTEVARRGKGVGVGGVSSHVSQMLSSSFYLVKALGAWNKKDTSQNRETQAERTNSV